MIAEPNTFTRLRAERDEARALAVELAQQISTDHPDEPPIYCPWEQHTASPPTSKEA